MALTKTNFINYSRCPRFVALSEIKKERLNADISYEKYKEEEVEQKLKEILGSIYEVDEEGNEEDLIDVVNPQLEVMMPYYKEIERLAGLKVDALFNTKSIYAESTLDQESFDFEDNGINYICYVDIFNEINNNINIIEVKATTSKKYFELEAGYKGKDKYPIFYLKDNIYHLKEELGTIDDMPEVDYIKNRNKLLDRYSKVGKYIYDLAVQRMYVEKSLKSKNKEVKYYLAVLNHEYIFNGKYENNKAIYSNDIVRIFDFTKITEELQDKVNIDKNNIENYIREMDACEYNLGKYCEYKLPSACKFTKICFKKIPKYNSSLSYMNNGFGFKDENNETHKGLDLINEGYLNMLDIPDSWIKNPNHMIQRNTLITHTPYINKEKIKIAINNLTYPIYHLDFETFPCPLPRFKGEKCYTQSPFQFSLHIEKKPGICDKEKDHYQFLATTSVEDCREELVKKLIEYIDVNNGGTVFAQNVSFEKGRLKELSEVFTEYKDQLLKIYNMASDLLYIVRNDSKMYEELGFDKEDAKKVNYYNELQSGSYSLKKVLPIFSNLSYDTLDVKNGTEALVTYASFPKYSIEEYKEKYENLIEYCKQDTYAMFVILEALRKLM